MRVEQSYWTGTDGWCPVSGTDRVEAPQLVLYFAAPEALASGERYSELREKFPDAHLLGCTTGGEILGVEVFDQSVVVAAVETHPAR